MNCHNCDTIVMVEPKYFCFNQETSVNNSFQHHSELDQSKLRETVRTEFYSMVNLLKQNSIRVIVLEPPENTPDSVFPNNWFSTHIINNKPNIFIYPMFSNNRR